MPGTMAMLPLLQTPRRRRGLDWRFLALALLLHAAVLLLPVLRESATTVPQRTVELWLRHEPVPAPDLTEPEVENTTDPVTPAPVDDGMPAEITAPTPRREADAKSGPGPVGRPERVPDARRIIDSLEHMDWPAPEPGVTPIARIQDHSVYEGLSRPLLPAVENLFNGLVLPATAKVVDRWLEPGGVHRVVVRLPNGTTVCGRQEPVNDFRPWEQMPMMFGECGGGGR